MLLNMPHSFIFVY